LIANFENRKATPDKKQSRVIATRLDTRMRLIGVMPITKRVADVVGRSAEERIWGYGRRSRPTGKMKSRRKLPEFAAESPTSGARFVG